MVMENKVYVPKGVLLIGMPGCGKSLSAKTMANRFNVPLLKIELGSLLNKYLGESEHNFRDALKLAEAISPCVLWVDELEKAFQGDKNNSQSESSSRILGYMLNWMQEKKSSTFVMATANNADGLPHFLRYGYRGVVFLTGLWSLSETITLPSGPNLARTCFSLPEPFPLSLWWIAS